MTWISKAASAALPASGMAERAYGHCAVKDDLRAVLQKIEKADAILIGSPIYLGITTGVTRCFLERLIYPYLVYDAERSSLFKKKIKTAFIYTAGATAEMVQEMGSDRNARGTEMVMKRIFGSCESFFVTDTLQFNDYSKYVTPQFDPEAKKQRHKEQFPLECKKAYELGASWSDRESNFFNYPQWRCVLSPPREPDPGDMYTFFYDSLPDGRTGSRLGQNEHRPVYPLVAKRHSYHFCHFSQWTMDFFIKKDPVPSAGHIGGH